MKKNKTKRPSARQASSKKPNAPVASSVTRSTAKINRPEPKAEAAPLSREAMESVLVAILLALLFRGFEAEAFIIPTGSMAPTLQGRHKDLACTECGYQYRVGAAQELSPRGLDPVDQTNCPMCRHQQKVNYESPNNRSFSGDRILVNKYVYQFTEPKRWDVIVFKCPSNPKQNYIKRLVGLPNETLRIFGGDVYAKPKGENEFQILRKPIKKLPYIMQLVHDTRYTPEKLVAAGWPSRWLDRDKNDTDHNWQVGEEQNEFTLAKSDQLHWLGYRHDAPSEDEWKMIDRGKLPESANDRVGKLVTDHYEYNTMVHRSTLDRERRQPHLGQQRVMYSGWHWVGDLSAEAIINVKDASQGKLSLRLVEGGLDHVFEIDTATGQATVTIEGGSQAFDAIEETTESPTSLIGSTPIKGSGSYRVMWANVDNQLSLWVNRKPIHFKANGKTHPGHFTPPKDLSPKWSPDDDGDLTPAAVGGQNISLAAENLKIFRDTYYVSTSHKEATSRNEYRESMGDHEGIQSLFQRPESWNDSRLFAVRNQVDFELGPDEFFPMGDNSPFSKDARLWAQDTQSLYLTEGISVDSNVKREMLIGKAFMVYWPHTWYPGNMRTPVPIVPNLDRMGLIR